jgi:hypothetical protein
MRKENLLWLVVIFSAGVLMIGIFFMTYSLGRFRADKVKFFRRSDGNISGSAAQASGPDLYLHSMRFDPSPKAGEPVGVLYITVGNQGVEESPGSSVSVSCRPLGGGKNICPDSLRGASVEFGSIPAGGSLTLSVPCSDKWNEGGFRLGVTVDPFKYARDHVRGNNVNFMDISVRPPGAVSEMPAAGNTDNSISADHSPAIPAGDFLRRSDGAVSAELPAKAVDSGKKRVPAVRPKTLFMTRDGSPLARIPSADMPGLTVSVSGAGLKSVFSGCSGLSVESATFVSPGEKSVPVRVKPKQRGDSCEFFFPGFNAADKAARPKCPGSHICLWDVEHRASRDYFSRNVSFSLRESAVKADMSKSKADAEGEMFTLPVDVTAADNGGRAVPETEPVLSVPLPVEFAYISVSPAGRAGSPREVMYRLFNNGHFPAAIGKIDVLDGDSNVVSDTIEAFIVPGKWDKARSFEIPDNVCGGKIQLVAYEGVGSLDKISPRKVSVPLELDCPAPGEKPDLVVSAVSTELPAFYAGQAIPVSCTVTNRGQAASPAASLWVLSRDENGDLPNHSRHTAEVRIPELKPGQEYAVMFQAVVTGAGDLSGFEVIADPLNIITESDERNNRSVFLFSEKKCFGSKKEYDDSLLPDILVDSFELLPMPFDLCRDMDVQAGCRVCYDAAGGGAGAAKVFLYAGEEVIAEREVFFTEKEICRMIFFDWKVVCGEKLSVSAELADGGVDRDIGNNSASLDAVCRADCCAGP